MGEPVYGSFANVADATSAGIPKKPPMRREDSVAQKVEKEVLQATDSPPSPEKPIETHSAEVITGEVKEEELSDEDVMSGVQETTSEGMEEASEIANSEEPMDDPEVHIVDDRASSLDGLGGRIAPSDIGGLGGMPVHELAHVYVEEADKERTKLADDPFSQKLLKIQVIDFSDTNVDFSQDVKNEVKRQTEALFSERYNRKLCLR